MGVLQLTKHILYLVLLLLCPTKEIHITTSLEQKFILPPFWTPALLQTLSSTLFQVYGGASGQGSPVSIHGPLSYRKTCGPTALSHIS